jgi:Domain of Unknown Function (DUF1080)
MILTINNDDGFVNLFDGRDQEGWCMAGPGRFQIIKQERALESEDGMGLLWYSKNKYNDFILKIGWKVKRENDNSGVFVRFSDPGNDPWIAVNTGYEIQIDDLALPERRPLHKTGAIYGLSIALFLTSSSNDMIAVSLIFVTCSSSFDIFYQFTYPFVIDVTNIPSSKIFHRLFF